MATTDFSAHETRQMLLAIRNWLREQGNTDAGHAVLDADAAESLGSDFGLDKPSSHRLVIDLIQEGYLDAESHTTDSEITPLRYAQVRGMTDKALGELS